MAKQLTRGLRNHNPLNIEKGEPWQGLAPQQTDPRFCQFIADIYGYRAALIIIRNYMRKRPPVDTVRKIIHRWAPPTENNTTAYLDYVCKVGVLDPDKRLVWSKSREDICRLIWAMARYETGSMDISFGMIQNAFSLVNRE